MSVETTSFLSLLEIHGQLNEMLLLHQEALLAFDLELAFVRLKKLEAELREHMRVEEELLLPVYSRAGRIRGGPIEFFTGEHKRLLEFLDRFEEKLAELTPSQPDLKRRIIELLDEQSVFKQLMQHHDMRERNILYPTLDKVTSEQERRDLLSSSLIVTST